MTSRHTRVERRNTGLDIFPAGIYGRRGTTPPPRQGATTGRGEFRGRVPSNCRQDDAAFCQGPYEQRPLSRLHGLGHALVLRCRLLDLTVYGRQETWEDSPPGWPQLFATAGEQFRTGGRPAAQWERLAAGRSDRL